MSKAYVYQPELLAPYLALPQGEKIQAECKLVLVCLIKPVHDAHSTTQTFGSMATAAFAQRRRYVLIDLGGMRDVSQLPITFPLVRS